MRAVEPTVEPRPSRVRAVDDATLRCSDVGGLEGAAEQGPDAGAGAVVFALSLRPSVVSAGGSGSITQTLKVFQPMMMP